MYFICKCVCVFVCVYVYMHLNLSLVVSTYIWEVETRRKGFKASLTHIGQFQASLNYRIRILCGLKPYCETHTSSMNISHICS